MGITKRYTLKELKKLKPVTAERLYYNPRRDELAAIGSMSAFHPAYGYEQANLRVFKKLGWKFIGWV